MSHVTCNMSALQLHSRDDWPWQLPMFDQIREQPNRIKTPNVDNKEGKKRRKNSRPNWQPVVRRVVVVLACASFFLMTCMQNFTSDRPRGRRSVAARQRRFLIRASFRSIARDKAEGHLGTFKVFFIVIHI